MRPLKDLMDLQGRVALIAGGAGHLGSVLGETLAELGASIVILDIARAACEQCADRLRADYRVKVLPLVLDLSDETALRSAPKTVLQEFGRLDIIVHSAAWGGATQAAGWAVPFEQQTVMAWDQAMRVNLTSAFVLV